ncbi:UDP-glycosyltransferase 71K1-like [Cannabis sativa]|uniref:Glycosyltransferase n=1 Tax=Cannabis sativa TaxID=3483 RepID=A0A7J6FUB4_CANSA|nr:UDP-glycosyltransferase 71K1-like [Cannabis sativa]KAF4374364.1 hypothetical protein F8388_002262 [Cannabis sativa]
MARVELVFIPAPAIGHLVSTLEFAKRLIHYDHRLFITVLCEFSLKSHLDAYIDSLVASLSLAHRIKLVHLPLVDSPPVELLKSIENFIYQYMESLVPHVRKALTDIVSSNSNYSQGDVVLVLDFFSMPMMDVANELGLPSYMFMTSNLGLLSLMFYLATRHNQISSELEESDAPLRLQGFQNPVPSSVLPTAAFCKDGGYSAYVKLAQRFRETKGIIVNSIEELESYSFSSMNDGAETPPIYMVGPVLDLNGQPHPSMDQVQNDKILKWLDEQPHSSVVFLCFGSMGKFGASQLREIASGLQRSGHRFLWSVRVQQPTTIDEILPEGFLEQIGSKGMICNEWAPQVKILAHSAVGGFLSHCGWNSILESLWYGVPVATWPIYAEQQLNAFRMVREFGLAVDLRLDYKDRGDDHIVSAEEIETAVKHLMEGDSEVRKKVKEMSETARKSVEEGGSSFTAIGKLINSIIGSNYY